MQSAAHDLGMQPEVIYAERDHTRPVEIAREIAARTRHPDFAIASNDYATGAEILKILDARREDVLAFSTIYGYCGATGGPRGNTGWIGSLEPHAEDAGYLTAKALIAQARKAHVVRRTASFT